MLALRGAAQHRVDKKRRGPPRVEGRAVAREFYWWAVDQGWGLRRMLEEIGRPISPGQNLSMEIVQDEIEAAWRELSHRDD